MAMLIPVILAGGLGKRLWPLSREVYPKQLMRLTGEGSLLQQSVRRAMLTAPAGNLVTVTTESQFFPIYDQLSEIDEALARHVLIEPSGRNTAAAIAMAALYGAELDAEAVLFVAPADHLIRDEHKVAAAVGIAAAVAQTGRLVTFGIEPTRAETGFGYIRAGAPITGYDGAFEVASFIEKPDQKSAEALIADVNVFWNSGMFVFRARDLLDELETHAPEIRSAAGQAFDQRRDGNGAIRFAVEAYERIPAAPIDKAVMERSGRVAAVPIDPGWSDVGSWLKLWEVSEQDEDHNATAGDVLIEDSRNCLVRAESRLVACVGLDDVVVTETADAVLVSAMEDDGGIRRIVDRLGAANREEAVRHLAENRPWGSFQVLLEGTGFKIKELVVKPGAILSLQSHEYRSEHWVVVAGTARTTCDEKVETLQANQSTYIPIGARHRLENPGGDLLRIIEVQCGSYVGEDDIQRYEDKYGREPAAN
ncbi:MAG: mannose-1-phosphate guanylyltransferase/mannose-6-phosphate isomerase [Alphaproteobacteria bacterium]|nr:mannose-1-phosphate guanylyltransferase/mannose-6-phosphate isomerase [Alphaproteobacteria bacterium]MDP6517950.1 mannose-1-phosphate guanylyltransferase/mannose-6-phosphate isomerase [Alphaproteobacteria bacterium]